MSSSIPLDITHFVGRRTEIAELVDLLRSGRLLTLTGAGGSGKTRIAWELLRSDPLSSEHPVAIVELANLTDAGLLTRVIAESFGIREEIGPEPAELVELLRNRSALLVLDNCEHIIDDVARVIDALLRACRGITVLATSREALGVRGERAWPVPALSLPSTAAPPDIIERAESVQLFIDRARDVSAGFSLTAENASAIAEICRRLDGMPLAIELAAARARVLHPNRYATASMTLSACSRAGDGPQSLATELCARRSTGVTSCWRSARAFCFVDSACSAADSPSRPSRRWARMLRCRTPMCWMSSNSS